MTKPPIKFIDLFAGIGGFHQAFEDLEKEDPSITTECVFVNEFDSHAKTTYIANHKRHMSALADESKSEFWDDITNITLSKTEEPEKTWKKNIRGIIPEFNILCAGFPCQPFSQAGFKKGFSDTRGTLFYDILRIIQAREPDAIFLENVRNLAAHDDGRTFKTILRELNTALGKKGGYLVPEEQGYNWNIVRASDFGLPTHRPRVYIVGFHPRVKKRAQFRIPEPITPGGVTLASVFGDTWPNKIGYTLRVGGKASGINDRRNWDSYLVDGKSHMITPEEGKLMMGFPKEFSFPVSKAQAMKQLGNSVAVNAIRATAREIIRVLSL